MTDSDDNDLPTTFLRHLIDRLQNGDRAAGNELVERIGARLMGLAHRMLRQFPGVGRYEQTGDVVQGATLRLLRALREVRPDNTRAFFNLAAELVRRELIDLARHHFGPEGWGANHESNAGLEEGSGPAAPTDAPEDMERWTAFHEAVARLPAEEREVFGLKYYHGWEHKEIAELIHRDERTARRRWRQACILLTRSARSPVSGGPMSEG